jgi:flagellar basal body-associated protein FliL
MIKFLLIIFLIGYLVFKVGGFVFRMFFLSLSKQQRQPSQRQTKTAKGENVNIEYPTHESKTNSKGFEGGEYVDFEELKD